MLKRSIYVWELPVRIYHWLNVILIIILFVTGLYIGKPFVNVIGDPTHTFLMGSVKYWHALAAWFFIANLIFRAYWALVGNRYAQFKPWRKGFFTDGWETLKYYLFLKKEHTLHAGHNVIAQLSYFFFMWVGSVIMVLTGLALQGEINDLSIQHRLFGWLETIFGSFGLRSYHHLVAWTFPVFVIVHLYFAFRQDILDDDGTVSSMFNGHRFLLADGESENDKD